MRGVLPGLRVPLAVLAAALCAATAPAASKDAVAGEGSRHGSDRPEQDSYVLAMGQHTMSTNLDFDAFARLREKRAGDFLWFRRAGRTYVVEDPATLRQAQELFAPLRALEPEQEALSRRQEELSEKEQELDREQDEIESRMDRLTDDSETEYDGDTEFMVSEETTPPTEEEKAELERELDELRGQQEALRPRQRELEAKDRDLDAVERSLDAREERLEREAERKLWKLIDASIESGVAKPAARP